MKTSSLVDIRLPSEWYETGVIKGSNLITFFTMSGKINPLFLEQIAAKFEKNDEIVLMCHSGVRSKYAMDFLRENGYTNVSDIRGGAWYYAKMGAKFEPYNG